MIPPPSARMRVGTVLLCVAPLLSPGFGAAQTPQGGDSVLATPRMSYDAHPWRAAMMGHGWRELWRVPVKAQVLDFDGYAGGLTVVRRGGGKQTSSLRMRGADGVLYNFRSIDKDAARGLDPLLQETFVAWAQQDQISAIFPMAAVVVAPLLDAAGVLHPDPTLVVMPDDPRLGEFQEEFAGLLGFIEERPDEGDDGEPGFAGSTRVISSDRLFERLEEDPDNRVDAEDFLRARLMDVFVGDWDRHPDQWRWAGFEDDDVLVFRPVPRDRDWALTRLDGLLLRWFRSIAPSVARHLVGFEAEYPPAIEITWSGRALDRKFLTGLAWSDWEAVASDLQRRLSDEVLRDAVGRMPEPYYDRVGDFMLGAFTQRRDDLMVQARGFYDLLVRNVDVFGTDEEEYALVEWLEEDRMRVRLWEKDREEQPRGEAFFDRTFLGSETEDVRLYLLGEQDRVLVQGDAPGRVTLRVVGGGRADVLIDETRGSGRVHFHDDRGNNEIIRGRNTKVHEDDYEAPDAVESYGAPPRDWGHAWAYFPFFEIGGRKGAYAQMGATRQSFGFRHYPYRSSFGYTAGIGTATKLPLIELRSTFPLGRLVGAARARYQGADRYRFFGLGNETIRSDTEELDFFQVDRQILSLESELTWTSGDNLTVSGGAVFELDLHSQSENENTLIAQESLYGFSDLFQFGIKTGIEWDGRDHTWFPTQGARIQVEATYFQEWSELTSNYGSLAGSAKVFLQAAMPMSPVLALEVGGKKVWGDYPYLCAAYLGGVENLRGVADDRYAGDAMVFAKSELRLRLASLSRLLPGQIGIHGMADVGRVYLVVELQPDTDIAVGSSGPRLGLVEVPSPPLPRFFSIPAGGERRYVVFLDDVIRHNLPRVFPGQVVAGAYAVKVSRDADLYLDDEFDQGLKQAIRKSLKKRDTGIPIRFLYDMRSPHVMVNRLKASLELQEEDLILGGRYHNLHDLFGFPAGEAPEHEDLPLPPLAHPVLDSASKLFEAVADKDRLLHFPYQSYDYAVRFLEEAAADPDVDAIWISLYRVARDSAVVEALIEAARNGKDVSAFVEVQARFDEELNLEWAERMEQAGVCTLYGRHGIKVHAKLALVRRREGDASRHYALLATGNFNEKTARTYSDHGLMNADERLTTEVRRVFRILGGEDVAPDFEHLLVAPFHLRDRFDALVDAEIEAARAGRPSGITAKMNSLQDRGMIDKLYEASASRVPIQLVIRGICCLRPGVDDLSETIQGRSIVDRFLEHSRMYLFHAAAADVLYLSSADWMTRNLNRRVEVAFPIYDPDVRAQLRHVLSLQLADNTKARTIDADQSNRSVTADGAPPVRSQIDTYRYLEELLGEVPAR